MSPARRRYRELSRWSDEALMTLLQQGHPDALNVLQERHEARLYHYLLKFTRDEVVARDLVQETFLRVYRSRHSYRSIARFTTWLFAIARNVARSEYRKSRRLRALSMPMGRRLDGIDWEVADEQPVPDEQLTAKMASMRLMRFIDRLPEGYRELVLLRAIQDLSYDEMHRVTGVPVGTIKTRIRRGRALLHEMLEE